MKNIYFVLIAILFLTMGEASAYHDRAWNKGNHTNNNRAVNASGCSRATNSTTIEYNNVRAMIHTGGDMWWDLIGLPKYEIPKNSGKTALFAGAIWMGGTDVNDQLRIAAIKFRSGGVDYWPGPLIISGMDRATVTSDVCTAYDRHFEIERKDVTEFRNYIQAVLAGDAETLEKSFKNYQIPEEILNWPAHGDVSRGYDYYLAPFIDNDGNGSYNPESGGDYPYFEYAKNPVCGSSREDRVPRLYGDKTMWWVYNDKGNVHTETNGESIGMEVRAQYFAFATADELNNMTFGNYALINRSTYTLFNTYFGVWTDADLGDPQDDYVGCDVTRGLGYLYNGDDMDGDGNNNTYGAQPPAIGVDFFEGPYMDPYIKGSDTLDRPSAYLFDTEGESTGIIDPNLPKNNTDVGLYNGGINGLNFGDSIPGNERWGMRRFLYFENGSGNNGDPVLAQQYYNYLDGYWKDNRPLVFGGTGYSPSGATASRPKAYFMFPGITDPTNWGTEGIDPNYSGENGWTEEAENNPAADKRFVQSAGPFTLQPGAVNDITVGMVWAKATNGGAFESVKKVQEADDKAQKLFDNCFVMIDGPDSPELKITELNQKFLVQIFNKKGQSNNYQNSPEDYVARDPFIVLPADLDSAIMNDPDLSDAEKAAKKKELESYHFEGYQVFQVKDKSVTTSDLDDPQYSRLVFQTDIRNEIDNIINYYNEPITGKLQPQLMVNGANKGVSHTFELTEDAFALADKALVNHKEYYFIAVAYAYNEYKKYDGEDATALDGQKSSYLRGRKSATGSIKTFSAIPHINQIQNGGIKINSNYGDEVAITQLEGMGNGNNELNLKQSTLDKIMSGAPWKTSTLEFEKGSGPISVKIVDPLNVIDDSFVLRFDSAVYAEDNLKYSGYLKDATWYMYSSNYQTKSIDTVIYVKVTATEVREVDTTLSVPMLKAIKDVLFSASSMSGIAGDRYSVTNPVFNTLRIYAPNTIFSDQTIAIENEQLLSDLGLAININQVNVPGPGLKAGDENHSNVQNGLISTEYIYDDPSSLWLSGVIDTDGEEEYNWIRTGNVSTDLWGAKFASAAVPVDPNNDWAGIFAGTFSLYRMAAYDDFDAGAGSKGTIIRHQVALKKNNFDAYDKKFDYYKRSPSVDIIITKDTNLWTQCPVVEMCEYDTVQSWSGSGQSIKLELAWKAGPSVGNQEKFFLRKSPSVYRNGKPIPANKAYKFKIRDKVKELDGTYTYPKHQYVASTGMGWFPGYAIDIETGERLNMFFGEDSRWGGYNGADMIWNPHWKEATDLYWITGGTSGEKILGAKHNVYVWGHSYQDTAKLFNIYKQSGAAPYERKFTMEVANAYDNGELLYALLTRAEGGAEFPAESTADYALQAVYSNIAYVLRPMLSRRVAQNLDPNDVYGFIKSDLKLKVRMANPYRGEGPENASTFLKKDADALNNNLPMYAFSTEGLGASSNNEEIAESALDKINIVPNPYYAYNTYELKQTQKLVKITNLPEDCVISIYNIGGNLVRKFDKSSPLTYLDWDLKNEYGIEIAGGVYIIHINVPGVGEKVLKWFGSLRPIDLNNI